jgi:hypothetical protein
MMKDGNALDLANSAVEAPKTRKRKTRAKVTNGIMALEPRVMFDGAAVTDAAHAAADDVAKALIPDVPAAVEIRAADPAQGGGKKEVAFVDTGLSDWSSLVAGIAAANPSVEIQLLDGSGGGLAQMAKWADSHSGYDAIHLISAGDQGTLFASGDVLTDSGLSDAATQAEMAQIGHALKAGGEIKLYGSNIAAGADGQIFLNDLAAATGAVVSAADHTMGDAAQGGSWTLNISTGTPSVSPLAVPGYLGVLDTTSTVTDATAHAVLAQQADAALDGGKLEVVFIDTNVAEWEVLVADIRATRPGVEIELIDGSQSGLSQMADWAATHQGYDAIHVLSHGAEGRLRLGTDLIDSGDMPATQARWTAIGGALNAQGDLLLYGCDIATGADGQKFIADLATVTGADVAASSDITGAIVHDGNWILERASGSVDVAALESHSFTGELAALSGVKMRYNTTFATVGANGDQTLAQSSYSWTFSPSTNTVTFTATQSVNITGGPWMQLSEGNLSSISSTTILYKSSNFNSPVSVVTKSTTSYTSIILSLSGMNELSAGDKVQFKFVPITKPAVTISPAATKLGAGETTQVTFTLDTPSTNFTAADVTVTGGSLTNFSGSGATYTATFTPTGNSTGEANISVAASTFTDSGNIANSASALTSIAYDTRPPQISSVTTTTGGTKIALTMTQTLDAAHPPAASAFTVTPDGGAAVAVSAVSVNGKTVELTLASSVLNADSVVVVYTDPTGGDDVNAVQDGAGGDAATFTRTITNARPTTSAGATLAYTEGGTAAAIDATLSITDTDDSNLTGATVTLSSGFTSGDTLKVASPIPAVTWAYNDKTGVLTLTGTATKAEYLAMLKSVAFSTSNAASTATSASRTVSWVVTDAGGLGLGNRTSVAASSTITITAVNDAAPVLDDFAAPVFQNTPIGAAAPTGIPLGATKVSDLISASGIKNYSDSDGDAPGIAITATNLSGGTLYYSINGGTTWTDVGAVTTSTARVLMADSQTYLFYKPASAVTTTTTIDDLITFRAWDRSGGYSNGQNGVNVVPAITNAVGTYNTPDYADGVTLSADGKVAYVADQSGGLQAIDVSNPAAPTLLRSWAPTSSANDVAIAGDYAYVADGVNGLKIVNLKTMATEGGLDTTANPFLMIGAQSSLGIAVFGDYAYLADGAEGLKVVNIKDPTAPVLKGTYNTDGTAWGVFVGQTMDGNTLKTYAYVADGAKGLLIIDVTNPLSPTKVGTRDTTGTAYRVTVAGDYAYVADDTAGIQIINIKNRAAPGTATTVSAGTAVWSMKVDGTMLYVAANTSLRIYDVSTPTSPVLLRTATTAAGAGDIAVSGNYAYVADGASGLKIYKVNESFSTQSDSASVTIKVVPSNTAPTIDLGGTTSVNWIEAGATVTGTGPVLVAANAVLSDSEQTTLSSVTVELPPSNGNAYDWNDKLYLAGNFGGLTIAGSGGRTITITGTASVATYQAALRAITFDNSASNPQSFARPVTITVNDGQSANASSSQTVTITGAASNDNPVMTGIVASLTMVEDVQTSFPSFIASSLTDDSGNEDTTITLSVNNGLINVNQSVLKGIAVSGSGTGTVKFVGKPIFIGSMLSSQANCISYTGTSNSFGDNADTLTITVNDGGNSGAGGGGTVTLATIPITINAVNDAPVVTPAKLANTTSVGQAISLSDFKVSDVDSANVTVTLTSVNTDAAAGSFGNVTDADSSRDGIQLTGTVAQVNAALAAATFTPSQAGQIAITVAASDGALTASGTYTLTAENPNTAPTLSNPATQNVATGDKLGLSFIEITDPDQAQSQTLTLTATGGQIFGLKDEDSITAGYQVTGNAGSINYALSQASFVASADGSASIAVTVNDGVAATASHTYAISASNPVPLLTTVTNLAGKEDTAQTIKFADLFQASDASDKGGSVDAFVVKAVNTGTLTINGSAWDASTNCVIDAEHSAEWTYGVANGFADNVSAFTIIARDNAAQDSASPVQVKINVGSVNDAPTLSGSYTFGGSTDETTTITGVRVSTLLSGNATAADLETVSGSMGIAITGTSALGNWQVSTDTTNGIDGAWTNLGEVSTQSAKLLSNSTWIRYAPDQSHGETATFTYRAWDGSEGSAGGTANATTTGGAAAYSTGSITASLTVTEIDDPLTLTLAGANTASYTENAQYVLDSDLTLVDRDSVANLTQARISISSGLITAEDRLQINGNTSGSVTVKGATLTYAYDTTTGVMTLTGTGSQAAYQAALRLVQYVNLSDSPTTTARDITISAGSMISLSLDGQMHFYQYVDRTSSRLNWTDAKAAAEASYFMGMQGYLVTITSQTEYDFVLPNLPGSIWLGASDAATEGTWKWVTGPEAGTTFYQNGAAVNGAFNAWGTVPNDYEWVFLGTNGEDYAEMFTDGTWNDVDNNPNRSIVFVGNYEVDGYLVEYSSPSITSAPFSKTITLTPTRVNDAPVLTAATPTLTGISEDATSNAGQLVSSIVSGGTISDADSAAAIGGIAVTGLESGNGTWQYRLDNTGSWTDIGTISDSSALLLRPSDAIRFLPNGENATSASFTYRAWDQTSGSAGQTISAATTGGSSAFSDVANTASITVTAVNDAPVFAADTTLSMGAIGEDLPAAAVAGQKVSALLGDYLSDVDAGSSLGVAITGKTAVGNGTWEYSTNNGSTWTAIGGVSAGSALLLSGTDMVRFVPDGIMSGTATLTVRGWDQSTGVHGDTADTTSNGGTTRFSSDAKDISLVVTPENDAPLLTMSPGSATYITGGNAVAIDPGLVLTEDGTLLIAGVLISEGYTSGDQLNFAPINGVVGVYLPEYSVLLLMPEALYNALQAFMGANGDAAVENASADPGGTMDSILALLESLPTSAQWQEVLRSVTYSTTSTAPTAESASRSFSFMAVDNLLKYDDVGSFQSRSLTISSQPQAPVIASAPATFAYTEDDGGLVVAGNLTLSDGDDNSLSAAQVVLNPGSAGFDASKEMLGLANTSLMSSLSGNWTASVNGISLSYTAATGVLDMSGNASVAEYQSVLRSITYVNTTDYATPGALTGVNARSITWRVTDANSLGQGAQQSEIATTAITINDANEAPQVFDANSSVTYTEGGAAVGLAINLTVSDDDADGLLSGAYVRLVGYAAGDMLNFTDQNGITGTFYDNGVLKLSGSASVSAYQAALRSITYSNTGDAPTATGTVRAVGWQILDGAGKASKVNNGARTIVTITPVNDAPAINHLPDPPLLGTLLWVESSDTVKVAQDATISDADDTRLDGATVVLAGTNFQNASEGLVLEGVTATTGSMEPGSNWTVTDVAGTGIDASYDASTATLTLSNTAIAASYEQVLHKIAYGSISDDPTGTGNTATRTLTWSVTDANGDGSGVQSSSPAVSGVTLIATPDAPILTGLSNSALSFTEGGTLTLGSNIVLTDGDDTQLISAKVWFSAGFTSGDVLNFTNQNSISGNYNAETGILTLSGTASVADYQAALRTVTFTSNDDPTLRSSSRAVSWTVTDANSDNIAELTSDTATVAVNVTATVDAPVVTPGANTTYTEGGDAVAVNPSLTLSDVDDTVVAGATITISGGRTTGDVLALPKDITAQYGISGSYNSGTGVLTLTGSATVAQYQAALRAVTFANTTAEPTNNNAAPTRTITWAVTDGNSDSLGAQTGSNTSTLTVTAVNSAPVLTAGASFDYTEGGGATVIDGTITLTDADDTQVSGATVTISSGYSAGDALGFSPQNGISIASNANGVLTLTGTATKAQYQTALRSVTFRNTGDDPTSGGTTRTISWAVADANSDAVGAQTSTAVTSSIAVTATADAPVLGGQPGSLSYAEGDAHLAIAPSLTLTDGDDTNMALASVSITGFKEGDMLSVITTDTGITAHYNSDTGLLSLSGSDTKAHYLSVLQSVKYYSTVNDPTYGGTAASRTFVWKVQDANSDSLGSQSSSAITTLMPVTANYKAPQAHTPAVDTAYTESDPATTLNTSLSLSDSDSTQLSGATVTISEGYTSGDVLGVTLVGNITIDSNANGVLTLTGTDSVSNYQKALRSVTFRNTGVAPTLVSDSRTISWAVTDFNATPANQKTSLAATSTVSVTPFNDLPTLTQFSAAITTATEDTAVQITLAQLQNQGDEADVDGGGEVRSFLVTSVVSGTLKIGADSASATAWAAGSNDVIDATHLAFWTPAANANGTVMDAFSVMAKDDLGGLSATAVTAQVDVTAVADAALVTSVIMPTSGTYGADSNMDFQVVYDHDITVDSSGGVPTLAITLQSGETVQAKYAGGSGSNTLVFRYVVDSGQFDTDGVSVASVIVANGGTLTNVDDGQTMTANLTLHGMGSSDGVLVDALAPNIQSVIAEGVGNDVNYTITLNKSVTGLSSSDFLLNKDNDVNASVGTLTGSGQIYTVSLANVSGDGRLVLNLRGNSQIRDGAGNALVGNFRVAELELNNATHETPNNNNNNNGNNHTPPPAPTPSDASGPTQQPAAPSISGDSGSSVITISNLNGTSATGSGLPVLAAVRGESNSAQALGMHTVVRDTGSKQDGGFSFSAPSSLAGPAATASANFAMPATAAPAAATNAPPAAPVAAAPVVSLAPVLSAPVEGGFRVAVVADGGKGNLGEILVAKPIGVVETVDGKVSFSVPADAFAVANADTQVSLFATQADGQPLPSWMSFNPATGKLEGTPPPGEKNVEIKLVARDKNGNEAVQVIKIEVKNGAVKDGNASSGKPGDAPAAKAQKTGFIGRPSLTKQLAAAKLGNTAHMAGLAKALGAKVA